MLAVLRPNRHRFGSTRLNPAPLSVATDRMQGCQFDLAHLRFNAYPRGMPPSGCCAPAILT